MYIFKQEGKGLLIWGGDPGGEDRDATQGMLRPPSLYPQDLHSSWGTCWTCHGQAEGAAERGESLLQFHFTFLERECLNVQHIPKVMAVEQQWGLAEAGGWL